MQYYIVLQSREKSNAVLPGRSIITSQMVLTEFLNHYAALGQPFRQRAVQVVRSYL
jgi:hypothetical protein